jgi:predicted MFS family arabinose efflux permease
MVSDVLHAYHCPKLALVRSRPARFRQFDMTDDSTSHGLAETNRAGAFTFAILFAVESLSRSFNASVLSVQAYDLLGSSRSVSMLSACVALTVLVTTLCMPYLIGGLRRRWTYTLGAGLMITACALIASYTIFGHAVGVVLRNTGISILNITLSLYIMDNIHRSDLTRSEPLRLSLSTFSWMVGPALGVWLYDTYGSWAPQLAGAATSMILLVVFWNLRLKENNILPSGRFAPSGPAANIVRFAAQPRLRLAWAIAFGRSCFWGTLFTYGPLLMIEGGFGKQAGGLLISASQAMLLAAFVFGRVARHIGVRTVISLCFLTIAVSCTSAGISGENDPMRAALLLLVASFFATGLDAVGGIPFLRSVRFAERQRMTSVYRTFIEFSELVPGAIFAVALIYFDTSIVFIVLGVSLLVMAAISWLYLPKSL